ncbi:MAG: carboxypeptidase-like regulatory domain-containing protein, partial [Blastocatellia bacterium]
MRSTRLFWVSVFLGIISCALGVPSPVQAQSTIATGSIQGTVTDRSGAIIPGAAVTIANRDTGQSLAVTTNAAGAYNSGALIPGNYDVRVEVKGFKTVN